MRREEAVESVYNTCIHGTFDGFMIWQVHQPCNHILMYQILTEYRCCSLHHKSRVSLLNALRINTYYIRFVLTLDVAPHFLFGMSNSQFLIYILGHLQSCKIAWIFILRSWISVFPLDFMKKKNT
jgi:hypothetical protein